MTDAPTTPDPIEIAMEAEAHDRSADSPARRVLEKQERLIETQTVLGRWQIASERAGFALKVLTGLAGVVAAALVGWMAWDASRADGLVVEAFLVPPSLVQDGASGEVVARDVLDRLGEIDAEAQSLDAVRVSDAWSQGVKIQVAQTGLSLDEIQRLLRRWLGHETLVSGEVVTTATGVRLKVRTSGGRAVVVEGARDQLPALAAQAAEGLFAQARPNIYAEVLIRRGRFDEARPLLAQTLATSADARERSIAVYLQASILKQGGPAEARPMYLAAAQSPDAVRSAMALRNVRDIDAGSGHLESAAKYSAAAYEKLRRAGREGDSRRGWYRAYMLMDRADYAGAALAYQSSLGRRFAGRVNGGPTYAGYGNVLAYLHRTTEGRRFGEGGPFNAIAEDWAAYLVTLGSMARAPIVGHAFEALALAELGRLPEARTVAWSLPMDCVDCVVSRAVVLSREGDVAGADRLFAQAAAMAPSVASPRLRWGRERLRQGRWAAALVPLRDAERLAPRWADPKAWQGEALLAKGDPKGAATRFADAAKLAPHWGRLRLKWGEALAKLGKGDEARAQWRLAAGLDLTAAERAELAKVSK